MTGAAARRNSTAGNLGEPPGVCRRGYQRAPPESRSLHRRYCFYRLLVSLRARTPKPRGIPEYARTC